MNTTSRRIALWLLTALYGGGSLWWLVAVPRNPAQLLRAIPGHAVVVSIHEHPADRWGSLSEHPLALILAGVSGADAEAWSAIRHDPGLRALLDLAGQDKLAAAYVPFLNYHREGAWVLASWIGGKSQRLRWWAPYLNIPGLQSMGEMGGWPIWTWSWETDQGAQQWTLALVEGMLLATSAHDPQAMQMIIDSYNGGFPSIASRADLETWRRRLMQSDEPDRIWYRQTGWSAPAHWFAEFDLSGTNRLAGSVLNGSSNTLDALPASFNLNGLADLWQQAPMASAALGAEALTRWLMGYSATLPSIIPLDVLMKTGAEAVVVGLFGGEFSGRFRGIKVPTLMAALLVADQTAVAAVITRIIDDWNASYQLGLVPVEQKIGAHTVWRIEGIAGGLYGTLAPAEQIAVTTAGSWLVISSNGQALEALIRSEAPLEAEALSWARDMSDTADGEGLGYLGFDLRRSTEAFRLAITAYSLKLLFEDAGGSRAQREKLNEAKAWLDILAQLEHLRLVAFAVGEHVKVDIQAGP